MTAFLKKIKHSNFLIRLRNWEYWPFGIVQLPVIFYYSWLALRSRSLFFFSASNPGIPNGGMFGESKYELLKKMPPHLIPTSLFINKSISPEDLLQKMKDANLELPVIFKPDIGERGYKVEAIKSIKEVVEYTKEIRTDFIVQELIHLPYEFGVFYRRYPSETMGKVISIVIKEMLHVTGNGTDTLKHLILHNGRAKLQWKKLLFDFKDELNNVVPVGKKIELVSIGNHARGTKFLDGSHLINDKLSSSFDAISKQIDGFYFGRFDVRTASLDDLNNGNVKIMELNGCGAEPAHIYDPSFKLTNAIGVLLRHWKDIFRISLENHRQGVNYLPAKKGIKLYRKFKAVIRK